MPTFTIDLRGEAELLARLRALSQKDLPRVVRKALRTAMAPLRKPVKAAVPRVSGRLRSSIGLSVRGNRRKGIITARVGPRKDYVQKGRVGPSIKPTTYGWGIERGTRRSGALARKAGPARFLEGTFESQQSAIAAALIAALRREIDRLTEKG